jgi:hypothetical protein
LDAKGNVVAEDDNGGGGFNSLIQQTLEPGAYYLVVKPAANQSSAGTYSLTTAITTPEASLRAQ